MTKTMPATQIGKLKPMISPWPSSLNQASSGMRKTLLPLSATKKASPRAKSRAPSVTMNGAIRPHAMRTPLASPMATPTRSGR